MTRKLDRDDGIRLTDDSAESWSHALKSVDGFLIRNLLAGLLAAAALLPVAGYSQTLDEAVNAQLEFVAGLECSRLLDGNPINLTSLTGGLLEICLRGAPSGGIGPSASTGGGAATPTALPSIVQARLREARSDETKPESGGASADGVAEFANGLGLFISHEYAFVERSTTKFEGGYDSDKWRVTAGADYQFTERIATGLAIDYYHQDGNFDAPGGFEIDSYGFLAFASFQPVDQVFVQLSAGYARKNYDRDRSATFTQLDSFNDPDFSRSGRSEADFNADEAQVSALMGYGYPIGNVTIGPQGGFEFSYIDFETYSEEDPSGLALTYHGDDRTSLQTRLGVQATATFTTGLGVVVPQASIYWKRELEDDQRDIEVSFVDDTRSRRFTFESDDPERSFFELNAGFVVAFPFGIQAIGNYRTLLKHSYFDSHAGTIGLRVNF